MRIRFTTDARPMQVPRAGAHNPAMPHTHRLAPGPERVDESRSWSLWTAAATRALEERARAELPPGTLMRRAGESVARLARALAPHARRAWVAAGPGGNGGDGLHVAATALSVEDGGRGGGGHGENALITALPRGERLETRYLEEDGTGQAAAAPGADVEQGGGAVRVKDDMMTSLNIDDYMQFRARPILAYIEKTAPWRSFELQCLEVAIFVEAT